MADDVVYDLSKIKKDTDDSRSKRGIAYIIVNERFPKIKKEGDADRKGAYADFTNMKKVFKILGFKLMTYYDKKEAQILDILKQASVNQELRKRTGFACVISSHGEQEERVASSQTGKKLESVILGVDNKKVALKDLVEFFSNENCPSLKGKPKLFFIQACRVGYEATDALDAGVEVFAMGAESSPSQKKGTRADFGGHGGDNCDEVDYGGSDTDTTDGGESDDNEDRDQKDHAWLKERAKQYRLKRSIQNNQSEDQKASQSEPGMNNQSEDQKVSQSEPGNEGQSEIRGDDQSQSDSNKDSQSETRKTETDVGGKKPAVSTVIEPIPDVKVVSVPVHADMLIMYATTPGKYALRDTDKGALQGGWLLTSFKDVVMENIRRKEFLEKDLLLILTEVAQSISFRESENKDDPYLEEKKMMSALYHKLTQEVVFSKFKDTNTLEKIRNLMGSIFGK